MTMTHSISEHREPGEPYPANSERALAQRDAALRQAEEFAYGISNPKPSPSAKLSPEQPDPMAALQAVGEMVEQIGEFIESVVGEPPGDDEELIRRVDPGAKRGNRHRPGCWSRPRRARRREVVEHPCSNCLRKLANPQSFSDIADRYQSDSTVVHPGLGVFHSEAEYNAALADRIERQRDKVALLAAAREARDNPGLAAARLVSEKYGFNHDDATLKRNLPAA